MIEPQDYVRKPFTVTAVRVTVGTVFEVAEWCKGEVKQINAQGTSFLIQVKVHRPQNDRQTTAYPGDWVVRTGNSFRIYSDKTFHASFEEKNHDSPTPTPGRKDV